jgi:protein-S-isoprenylcysteine O-methyltransferase Ste14
MDTTAVVACLLGFVEISCLPLFFLVKSDGRLNSRWWLTAAPFFVTEGLLIAGLTGGIRPESPQTWSTGLGIVASVAAAASIALMSATWGTHRIKLALWHQDNDAPQSIVTVGPYRMIRHPFYTSFLLAMTSAALALPHWSTLTAFAYTLVALNVTAAREERRLAAGEFATEYRAYAQSTGRFLPRLRIRDRIPESAWTA